jgi:hypothetical protein
MLAKAATIGGRSPQQYMKGRRPEPLVCSIGPRELCGTSPDEQCEQVILFRMVKPGSLLRFSLTVG